MRLFTETNSTDDTNESPEGHGQHDMSHIEKHIASGTTTVHDPALERRVVRKLDWHVLSLLFALYLLAFLDRSNIGNAEIAGMQEDLDLGTGGRYPWLLTIFYISYVVFEPLIMVLKILPAHYWVAFLVFVWGLAATSLAATSSWAGAMALRFIMGAAEAGYGPGTVYFLSFFYLRNELGFRQGIFLSAAPLASTFAGALAYGITSGHARLAAWRLLFLVEGLPTICMSVVAFFFLANSPATARFLNEEEKEVARARSVRQVGIKACRTGSLDWRETFVTLLDVKPWITSLMYFSCNTSFASLPVYLPTLLTAMGYSSINAQGLSAPPYFVAFLITITTVWVSDRTQQRGYIIVCLSLVGSIGYVILATATKSVGARYFATFLVAGGVFPTIANILPWVSGIQGSDEGRGAGFIILNLVGQCGPILGTRLYPTSDQPDYVTGHSVCAGLLFFTVCLAIILRLLIVRENKKLDIKWGTVEEQRNVKERAGEELVGVEDFGPLYRYAL